MSTKELAFAASTVWVFGAAVLAMCVQAGFAFLEAGLTRMKNVGHIAAKNVLVLAIASIVYYLVGFGIAFGDGGNGLFGGSGFVPSVDSLLAIGAAPFSWFSAIPGAAGYLFEVVFCAVSLAIVWGAMAERARSPVSPEPCCSGRGSASSATTASRMRSPATTWRSRRWASSSSGSAGSASTRARR